MNDFSNRREYNPFVRFCVSARPPRDGEIRQPIVQFNAMEPPAGSYIQGFNTLQQPCSLEEDPMYIVHPESMTPPRGYARIDVPSGQPEATIQNWLANAHSTSMYLLQPQQAQRFPYGIPVDNMPCQVPQTQEARQLQIPQQALDAATCAAVESEANGGDGVPYSLTRGVDGYYLVPEKGTVKIRVTNFLVDLKDVSHRISMEWAEQRETQNIQFEETVFVKNGPSKRIQLKVDYENLKTICSIIEKRVGEAIIFKSKKEFADKLQIDLREQLPRSPHVYEYMTSGWVRTGTGEYIYIHDGAMLRPYGLASACNFRFGRGACPRNKAQIVRDAFGILDVSPNTPASIIPFLWAHMSLLYTIFRDAGFTPHALLFIDGTTGSLKTAVASCIFNFTGEAKDNIPATFRDTSASMEVEMGKFRDRTLLVDDFCPAPDQASRRNLEQNLEQIVRFYGDGIAKARTNPKLDKVQEKSPQGLCVITGEDIAGSQSSQLRCLFIHVDKGTYDGKVLEKFQKMPYLWTENLAQFVEYIGKHAEIVIEEIRNTFPVLRAEAEKHLKERRLADICAYLMMTAGFVLQYATDVAGMESKILFGAFNKAIAQTCSDSEQRATQMKPSRVFAQSLLTLLQQGDISLAEKDEFEATTKGYVGVRYKGYWYLWPDKAYSRVRAYCSREGREFPLGMQALWKALASDGVLIPNVTERNGKKRVEYGTKISFAGRPRLLKIDPKRFYEIAEDE